MQSLTQIGNSRIWGRSQQAHRQPFLATCTSFRWVPWGSGSLVASMLFASAWALPLQNSEAGWTAVSEVSRQFVFLLMTLHFPGMAAGQRLGTRHWSCKWPFWELQNSGSSAFCSSSSLIWLLATNTVLGRSHTSIKNVSALIESKLDANILVAWNMACGVQFCGFVMANTYFHFTSFGITLKARGIFPLRYVENIWPISV